MDEKLQKLKDWIAECDNIVFFGGAGVSTESGIPDFRGEKGIFTAISEYGYRPEIILSHSFLRHIPIFSFNIIKRICSIPMQNQMTAIRHWQNWRKWAS